MFSLVFLQAWNIISEFPWKQLILNLCWFFYHFLIQIKCASLWWDLIVPVLQDAMLREIRRPKGDPEVLAAQSREQYFKVCGTTFM